MSETEYEIYFAGIDWGATFDLFPKIEEVSQLVLISSEADILSSCYLTDSCSIFQETIDGKIFKS